MPVHMVVARKFSSFCYGLSLTPSSRLYKDKKKFIRHLRNGHFRYFTCVSCYHSFSTPSALLAHMESSTRNCFASVSDLFDHSVVSISGGVLKVSGENIDGTKKLVSVKAISMELLENLIEGLDLWMK